MSITVAKKYERVAGDKMSNPSASDVAAKILEMKGSMSAMKLQKLCYYAHAWHLVWHEAPLFPDEIQAWANGPVIPRLYAEHKGQFRVESIEAGDPSKVCAKGITTLTSVLAFYGEKTAQWLSDLTHMETPWKHARAGLPNGSYSDAPITDSSMHEYYSGLVS